MRVPEWYKPPYDPEDPGLAISGALSRSRRSACCSSGSQIVVARSHGAAVADVSLYGVSGGKLDPPPFSSAFLPGRAILFVGTVGTGCRTRAASAADR